MTTNVETTPWYKSVWFIAISIIMVLIILAGSITAIVLSVDGNGNGAPRKHLPDNGSEIEGLLSIKEHELFVKKELNLSNLSSNKSSLSYSIFYEYNGIIEVVAFVAKRDANLIFNLSVYGENVSYYSEYTNNEDVITEKESTTAKVIHEEVQLSFNIFTKELSRGLSVHYKNLESSFSYLEDEQWIKAKGTFDNYVIQNVWDSNGNERYVELVENISYYDELYPEDNYENITGSFVSENEDSNEYENFDLNYLDFDYIEFSL